MVRVHVAPTATAKGELEVYRAPPLREAPSEQARLHVFPVAHLSTEKVIIEEIGGNDGGGGGDGGGDGGDGGDGGGWKRPRLPGMQTAPPIDSATHPSSKKSRFVSHGKRPGP